MGPDTEEEIGDDMHIVLGEIRDGTEGNLRENDSWDDVFWE